MNVVPHPLVPVTVKLKILQLWSPTLKNSKSFCHLIKKTTTDYELRLKEACQKLLQHPNGVISTLSLEKN